ncbi:MAG TPA: efflux RND transporter periplasmic adaptor subunit [Candidatus Acidoferrum sp.]|nr:efflux RND transporter periplasmic adaptor subunit [Candidatus Acidoferrum sp.]
MHVSFHLIQLIQRATPVRGVTAKRAQLSVLSAVVCAVALLAGCGQKEAAGNEGTPAVAVKTSAIAPVPIAESSEYLATLKSRHSTVLNPQVEGQITNIFVKSGDHVKAGAALMQIDPIKQQATVGTQEAARAAQEANVHFAQIQWERSQKLFEAGVISKQDYDQARTNLETAQSQLKSLDSQVLEQQAQLHYYRVNAPTDGIVGDIPVRVGDRVTNTTTLTTVDQPGPLEVYINVPVERSKDLKRGQKVELLDSQGAVANETQIDFISAEVDNSTQSVLAKATVKNSADTLRTSQFARTRVIWAVRESLVVPVLAVQRINGQYFAFVVEGSGKSEVAHQKVLRLGDMIGNNYPVLEGLKPGDRVVIEGAQNLVDGTPVTEAAPAQSGKPSS